MNDTCVRANNGTLVCTIADVRALLDQWDADVINALPPEYHERERAFRAKTREYDVKALCPRYGIRYSKPS